MLRPPSVLGVCELCQSPRFFPLFSSRVCQLKLFAHLPPPSPFPDICELVLLPPPPSFPAFGSDLPSSEVRFQILDPFSLVSSPCVGLFPLRFSFFFSVFLRFPPPHIQRADPLPTGPSPLAPFPSRA